MQRGFNAYRATEAETLSSYFLTLQAEVQAHAKRAAAGLSLRASALNEIDRTQTRWIEAELYRVRRELLLAHSEPDHQRAEACFRQALFRHALAIAGAQDAKLWQLRSATSLARMWRDQGRWSEAQDLLAPIYGWFTEGFDTPDLVEAQKLVEELRTGRMNWFRLEKSHRVKQGP